MPCDKEGRSLVAGLDHKVNDSCSFYTFFHLSPNSLVDLAW